MTSVYYARRAARTVSEITSLIADRTEVSVERVNRDDDVEDFFVKIVTVPGTPLYTTIRDELYGASIRVFESEEMISSGNNH